MHLQESLHESTSYDIAIVYDAHENRHDIHGCSVHRLCISRLGKVSNKFARPISLKRCMQRGVRF